jgi:hypothetical protein
LHTDKNPAIRCGVFRFNTLLFVSLEEKHMEARDLRIGNKLDGGEVVAIHKSYFTIYDGYSTWNSNMMVDDWTGGEPIPLTPDELMKLGFTFLKRKSGTQGIYSNGKMNVQLSNSGNVYTSRGKLIPYVHTLQNVYYYHLLTGEELTYTT